ncbi:MAG: helix-turn-helix transcriptional regulator [Pirellulales bacterium]
MAIADDFRTNLRRAMKKAKVSQRALASKAGMGYAYINRVLAGTVQPTLPQCERLAVALGAKIDYLLGVTPSGKSRR